MLKKAFVFVKTSLHSVQQTIHLCQEAQNFYRQDRNGKTPFLSRGKKYMYIYNVSIYIYIDIVRFIHCLLRFSVIIFSDAFLRDSCVPTARHALLGFLSSSPTRRSGRP